MKEFIDIKRGFNRIKETGSRQSYESQLEDRAIQNAWLQMRDPNVDVKKVLDELVQFDESRFFEDLLKGKKKILLMVT